MYVDSFFNIFCMSAAAAPLPKAQTQLEKDILNGAWLHFLLKPDQGICGAGHLAEGHSGV